MRLLAFPCAALLCAVLTALGGQRAVAQYKADWPTFGFDTAHDGGNTLETKLRPETATQLQQIWAFDAAAFAKKLNPAPPATTGAFLAQPLLATAVEVQGGTKDLVLIGDNDGLFFALDAKSSSPSGTVVWFRRLPVLMHPGCPTAGPAGILGTAVIERAVNAVYVASNARVYGFMLGTGDDLPGWPKGGVVIPRLDPAQEGFIRAGLTLADGELYVANSSKCDFPPFHGQIARIDTRTAQVSAQWFSLSGTSKLPARSGGSIWGPGGVSAVRDAVASPIFTATGNGMPAKAPSEVVPYAEAVLQLSPNLSRVEAAAQVGFISDDDDFGSTPVLFQAARCRDGQLAVQQKSGQAYIFRRSQIGKILPQTLKLNNSTDSFRGDPAWDAEEQLLLFTNPADGPAPYGRGLVALRETTPCHFALAWQTSDDLSGNPIIANDTPLSPPSAANGVVYFGVARAKTPTSPIRLYAVADRTNRYFHAGQVLWQSPPYGGGVVSGPIVINGQVFAATLDGHVYAYGLPAK